MAEVATFVNNVTQFEPGESTGMCVAFSFAQIAYMSPPGTANPHTAEEIDQLADTTYQFVTGQMTQPIGITPDQLKDVLGRHGITWKEIGTDIASIDTALNAGCPVIVQGAESGFTHGDGSSPYPWNTSGFNHCIVIAGIYNNNLYEVYDSANSGNTAVVYSKNMSLFNAIKIMPAWNGGSMIPTGWSDNGTILTAPNGIQVVLGFRDYILNHTWDPANVPQALEYPANPVLLHAPEFGAGQRQLFRNSFLWYTPAKGVINEAFLGWELHTAYQELMTAKAAQTITITKIPDALTADIKQLIDLVSTVAPELLSVTKQLSKDAGL